jgi:alkylation response protein AidB-like acyl-CoA dehydrogenase
MMQNFTSILSKVQQLQAQHPSFANSTLIALSEAAQLNVDAEAQLDNLAIKSCLARTPENMLELQTLIRQICDKDLAFGLSYCLTSFMAATNIWLAGNDYQRGLLADIFAKNGVISIAYHEPAHGNDLAANQFQAIATEGGFLLSGHKHVVNNVHRADAIVIFARTGGSHPARQHTLFLIPRDYLVEPQFSLCERVTPQGVNSCHITGFECKQLFIPTSCQLGELGFAVEYALRAFQITRTLLPGISLGTVQTAFNQVSDFAQQRVLYGKKIALLPHVSDQLTQCGSNLFIAQAMTEGLSRGLHLCPDKMAAYSAANKYFVPKLMRQTLKQLASVYGARYYLRGSLFEKILRDYQVVNFGHAGSLVCQASLIAQLDKLLAPSKTEAVWLWQDLPKFDMTSLRLGVRRGCVILASLDQMLERIAEIKDIPDEDKTVFHDAIVRCLAHVQSLKQQPVTESNAGLLSYQYCLLLAATCLIQQYISAPTAPIERYTQALTQITRLLHSPYADFKSVFRLGQDLGHTSSTDTLAGQSERFYRSTPFYYTL